MNAAKKLINTLKDVKGTRQKVDPVYMTLVKIFPLQSLISKKEHETALGVLQKLISYLNDKKNPDEGAKIYVNTLAGIVNEYEKIYYKTSTVSGTQMLTYLMELQGLSQSDLSKELGGQPVVSKILNGERELNIRQIKALSKRFNVSPEVFI